MAMSYLELLNYLLQVQQRNPEQLLQPAVVLGGADHKHIHSQMDLLGISNIQPGSRVRYRSAPNPLYPDHWREQHAGKEAVVVDVFNDRDFVTVSIRGFYGGRIVDFQYNWWIHNVDPV